MNKNAKANAISQKLSRAASRCGSARIGRLRSAILLILSRLRKSLPRYPLRAFPHALAIVLFFSFINGCAKTTTAGYPHRVTPEIQRAFNLAEEQFMRRAFAEADEQYAQLIEQFPYTELTDRAHFQRAEIRFTQGNYEEALPFYRLATAHIQQPDLAPKAHFKAATSLCHVRRDQETIAELEKINRAHANILLRLQSDSLALMAFDRMEGVQPNAVRFALFLLDDYAEVSSQEDLSRLTLVTHEEAKQRVFSWMDDGAVTAAEVSALPLDTYKGKKSGGYVFYKFAKVLSFEGDQKKAHEILSAYLQTYPQHEMYPSAKLFFAEVGGRIGDRPIKIGVIVPLSGKYRVYGESVLHGIECAAGIFEPCVGPGGVELIVRDSKGEAEVAVRAVEELASLDVQAIIGPLTSQEVEEAAKKSETLGVPMIALSQKEGIPQIGKYIFRNSITPMSQVKTLLDYVIGKKQMTRFFVLYPENPLGKEFDLLFRTEVERQGASIVGSRSYLPHRMDFAEQLRGIDATYDALFIPDAPHVVGFLAPTLSMLGMERVTYLGTARWDNPDLVERGGTYIHGAIFVGGFVKKSTEYESQNFTKRFYEGYATEPTLLEALGYDSMRMLFVSIQEGAALERASLQERLARLTDFQGATGRMYVDQDGDIHRRLTLLTVTEGEISPIVYE